MICSCLPVFLRGDGENGGTAGTPLRYLLAIYGLDRNDPDMGTQAVAKALNLAPLCYLEA